MDFNEILYCYRIFWVDSLFFSGRTRRFDFWVPVIINFLITAFLGLFGQLGGTVVMAFNVVALIPGLANEVRRLHDIGKSAWWLLLYLVPVIGWIVLLVFFLTDSKGDNRYGESIKYSDRHKKEMK